MPQPWKRRWHHIAGQARPDRRPTIFRHFNSSKACSMVLKSTPPRLGGSRSRENRRVQGHPGQSSNRPERPINLLNRRLQAFQVKPVHIDHGRPGQKENSSGVPERIPSCQILLSPAKIPDSAHDSGMRQRLLEIVIP